MATIYEIIQGLSQAAANAYDGALGEDYEPIEAGLKREDGNPLIDPRIMDGFNVKFYGNMMCLSYQSEIRLKEVYYSGFEDDIESRLTEIGKWIQKEYKKITGNSVKLTAKGETDIHVENTSRIRTWVTATKHYSIGGLDEDMADRQPSKDRLEASWKKFLDQGPKDERPKNDSRNKAAS